MAPVLAADSKVTAASSLLALDASLAKLLRTFYHSIPTNSDSSRPPLAAVQSAVLSSMSSSSPVTTNSNSILHTASDGSALPIGMHLPITASRSTTTCNQNSQQHGQSGLAPDTESHCPIPSTQSNQSPPSNQLDPQTQPSTTSASPQSHDSATCQWVVLSSAGTEFVCGAQFATTDELSLHLNDTHIGRKVTRNLCLHCRWLACSHSDTPFHKRDHIKSHIKSHLPLKAFSCQVCHKSYKWHHDFNKHQAKTGHASVLPLVKSKSHLSHDSSMGVELEGSVVSSSFPRPTSPLSLIAKPQMNDTLSATSSPKPVHLLTTIPTPPSLASSSSTTKRRRTENDIHHHVVDRHHTKHLRALLPAPNCRTAPTTVYSESINSIYAASVPSNGDGVSVYPKYALSTTSLDYHDCTDYHDYHQQDHHHPDPLVDSTLSTSSTRFLDASTELQIMDFLQSLPVPDTGAHIHPLQIDNSLMAPLSTLPQSQPSMLSISAPPPFYFEYPDALWQTTSNSVGFTDYGNTCLCPSTTPEIAEPLLSLKNPYLVNLYDDLHLSLSLDSGDAGYTHMPISSLHSITPTIGEVTLSMAATRVSDVVGYSDIGTCGSGFHDTTGSKLSALGMDGDNHCENSIDLNAKLLSTVSTSMGVDAPLTGIKGNLDNLLVELFSMD